MTVKEFYDAVGGDYEGTLSRFVTEDRMKKFALKFGADPSYNLLKENLAKGLQEESFRAAHTLKGVCQYLGFVALYTSASLVCEMLRAGNMNVEGLMPPLDEAYKKVIAAIKQLEE